MFEAETVSETSDYNTILTPLIAREDFVAFEPNFKLARQHLVWTFNTKFHRNTSVVLR